MTATPTSPLRVGLAGAGPWAALVHAPTIAAHPRTELAGVWARRADAAAEVATANGTTAAATFDELLDRCDAVVFAVPPDVQVELGCRAAAAGKALLLEKPVALDVAGAERLVAAVDEAGVGTQMVLTWRYSAAVRSFLADVARSEAVGARGEFVHGALIGGMFATPWRVEHGPLLDLGPHVIDLLDAALGRVVGVRARGDRRRWVALLLEHESGVVSDVVLSGHVDVPMRVRIEVHTPSSVLALDGEDAVAADTFTTVLDELVATAAGAPHPLDVHRGLHLQRVLAAALDDLVR